MTPIYQSSTFAQRAPGEHQGYEYSRSDNPTRTPLQRALAALEGAKHALVFSSGLAAADCVLNSLKSGDHVLAGDDLYGGTYRLFTKVAENRGLEFSFSPMNSEDEIRKCLRKNTKLIWLESPTNPLLRLIDIGMVASIAHERDTLVGVDNTFMSPYFQSPLALGADIVMHSMTKYINGHSDVVMGCLALDNETLFERLKFLQNAVGGVPSPFDCFLALRGIKTLALRMKQHEQNALKVASFLESHPKVERVIYPGLASHPQHELAKRQARGFGGMVSFVIKGNLKSATEFLKSVELFTLAESLGGVESLIEHPAIMTHASVPIEIRDELGISDSLIRISCGIEHADDLVADLDQALRAS